MLLSNAAVIILSEIKLGDKGPLVAFAQACLNECTNRQLTVDGSFGPNTEAALKAFQRECLLSETGILNSATWGVLFGKAGVK